MSIFYDLGFVNRGGRLSSPDTELLCGNTLDDFATDLGTVGGLTSDNQATLSNFTGTTTITQESGEPNWKQYQVTATNLSGGIDISPYTKVGTVTIESDPVYGGVVNYNRTGYLTTTTGNTSSLYFGDATSFTMEAIFKGNSFSSGAVYQFSSFFAIGVTYLNFGVTVDGRLRFYWYDGGLKYLDSAMNAILTNTWYNVAVVVNGSNIKLFINGELKISSDTFTFVHTGSSGQGILLGYESSSGNMFDGKVAGLKITKNEALYSDSYTPVNEFIGTASTSLLLSEAEASIIVNGVTQTIQSTSGSTTVFTPRSCDTSTLDVVVNGTADLVEIDLWT